MAFVTCLKEQRYTLALRKVFRISKTFSLTNRAVLNGFYGSLEYQAFCCPSAFTLEASCKTLKSTNLPILLSWFQRSRCPFRALPSGLPSHSITLAFLSKIPKSGRRRRALEVAVGYCWKITEVSETPFSSSSQHMTSWRSQSLESPSLPSQGMCLKHWWTLGLSLGKLYWKMHPHCLICLTVYFAMIALDSKMAILSMWPFSWNLTLALSTSSTTTLTLLLKHLTTSLYTMERQWPRESSISICWTVWRR